MSNNKESIEWYFNLLLGQIKGQNTDQEYLWANLNNSIWKKNLSNTPDWFNIQMLPDLSYVYTW